MAQNTILSVVIPTYNRCKLVQLTLENLFSQSLALDKYEVIIIDDGSEDGTYEMLSAKEQCIKNLRAYLQKHKYSGAARNLGIAHARGQIILSMDDDIVADRFMLEEHLKYHAKYPSEYVAVRGKVITGIGAVDLCTPNGTRLGVVGQTPHGDKVLSVNSFVTNNVSWKRDWGIACGSFTPGLDRLDDRDLGMRMQAKGLQLLYAPDAIGIHLGPMDTVEKVVISGKRYGRCLGDSYDQLPWVKYGLAHLGARLNGGWTQLRGHPFAYLKDAIRRWTINRLTIGLLHRAAAAIPIKNPPSRVLVRLCKEIWAYYYREGFVRRRREVAKLNSNRLGTSQQ